MKCPECGHEWDKKIEWKPDLSQIKTVKQILKELKRKEKLTKE